MENNTNQKEENQVLKFGFKTTAKEIKESLKIAEKIGRDKNFYLYIVLGVVAILGGILFIAKLGETYYMPIGVLIICAGVFIVGKYLLRPFIQRGKMAKKIEAKGLLYEVEFDSVEMYLYINNGEKKTIPYRSVFVRDTKDILIIILSTGEIIPVPKSCLDDKEEVVCYILKNNLGARYKQA